MTTTKTSAASYPIRIYMAGPVAEAEKVCREFCYDVGFCVTVTPTKYVYKGGEEAGFIVGIINYPRFPMSAPALEDRAGELAALLMERLHETSYTIETPANTHWYSRREQ
ncbi:MAG TPA: hypothetical protein VHQ87_14995 [Rhizobacter sp.]|jgi:hypothetical protein|nr:hypothetical protein [Rhizobacter sp.]